ncbi:MAG: hypothetical protein GWN86_10025, partial [Desulfobacterales bacterium]|nr:hypothetical protein [Desulfobacterales bacterium]
ELTGSILNSVVGNIEEETSEEETSGEETSGEETSGEETSGEETSGEEKLYRVEFDRELRIQIGTTSVPGTIHGRQGGLSQIFFTEGMTVSLTIPSDVKTYLQTDRTIMKEDSGNGGFTFPPLEKF